MSCPGALCRAPPLSVLGPDALCVEARRSRALFVGSRRSLCRGPALFRHSLCRDRAFSEPEPGGARRSLSQDPALSRSCRRPALSVSVPGALRVRARRSLCRRPALSVSVPGGLCVGPRRSVSGPGAFCSLCRAPALSVSGPGGLCVGARRFCVGALRSFCRGPALSVSGPGALCVGPRRSLLYGDLRRAPGSHVCRAPALSASGPAPACHLSVRGPPAQSGLMDLARSHTPPFSRATHPLLQASTSDPRATYSGAGWVG